MRPATHPKLAGWANWSGNQAAPDCRFVQAKDEHEIRQLLTEEAFPIRVAGAGHSFTPIVSTSGTVISLDQMGGVVSADPVAKTARIRAGGRLRDLSPELEVHGLAFRNLGDIDVQSFAGAVSTATHGTGEALGCIAAEIFAVKLMTASGDILELSEKADADLLHAAQVSLGALGIMLEAEVRLKDAYRLHRRTWVEPIEQIIAEAPGRWSRHRHYEFLYIPFSGYGINISHDETDAAETQRRPSADEAGLASLRRLRDWLRWSTTIRRRLTAAALQRTPTEDVNGTSWKLLASERRTPFNEMEYHLPPDAGLAVFKEVIAYIEAQRRDVFFPIEVRKTAGDQSWLSPFQGGPRVSIAVHAQAGEDHSWFFDGVEPMFRAASGRPHWGKLHSLAAEDLAALYPDFERFTALRRKLDPDGRFMTPDLARYWGES